MNWKKMSVMTGLALSLSVPVVSNVKTVRAAVPVQVNYVTDAQKASNQAFAKFRQKVYLQPLKVNPRATQVAELRAQQELNSYIKNDTIGHYTRTGQSKAALVATRTGWFKSVAQAKTQLSENIAAYQVSGTTVMRDQPTVSGPQLLQQFINEGPGDFNAGHGHYDNLVDTHNQSFGSGVAVKKVGNTYYYVLVQTFVR